MLETIAPLKSLECGGTKIIQFRISAFSRSLDADVFVCFQFAFDKKDAVHNKEHAA